MYQKLVVRPSKVPIIQLNSFVRVWVIDAIGKVTLRRYFEIGDEGVF